MFSIDIDETLNQLSTQLKECKEEYLSTNVQKGEIQRVQGLISKWGPDKTLGSILSTLKKYYKYTCPKCNGAGFIIVHVPEYLGIGGDGRDVGCHDAYDEEQTCDLCNGIGYTTQKYVPHYVQDGWEPEEKESEDDELEDDELEDNTDKETLMEILK